MKPEWYSRGDVVDASASAAVASRPVIGGNMSLMEEFGLQPVSRRSGSKNEVKVIKAEGSLTVITVRLYNGPTTPVERRLRNCSERFGAIVGMKQEEGVYTLLCEK